MKSYNDSLHNLIYNIDASHLPQNEDVEVFIPENKEDIVDIINKAIKENKKVLCRWWWTNLVWNCLPWKNSIIIDLSKMNKIVDINNDYVVVEPWITNDQLNENLKEKWLFFPVVLWSHAWAEIWWMVSTNWAWMRAIKYWKMERWVEELEVLTFTKDKNVEIKTLKWDDCKDFLWSEWSLWIVLKIKLRTIKTPNERSIDFESFNSISDALNYVKEIKETKDESLSALEIINPQVAGYLNLEKKYYILVEYENNNTWKIKDKEQINKIRANRDACYAVTINAWYDQIEDPEIHTNEEEFFKRFENNNIPIFWHIWIWVLHPHFKSNQHNLEKEMYNMVNDLWWKVSWEHWIWKKKMNYLSEDIISKKEQIKIKRDPNNIFWY